MAGGVISRDTWESRGPIRPDPPIFGEDLHGHLSEQEVCPVKFGSSLNFKFCSGPN